MTLSVLGGAGAIILISGSWLARSGVPLFRRQELCEFIAGFLIIAGLSCIGASLGILFGTPLP
jgi:hypothetical protein